MSTRRSFLFASATAPLLIHTDDDADEIETILDAVDSEEIDEWFGDRGEHDPDVFDPAEDGEIVGQWMEESVELLENTLAWSIYDSDSWEEADEEAEELREQFFEEIDPLFFSASDEDYSNQNAPADGIPAYDLELAIVLDGPSTGLMAALAELRNYVYDFGSRSTYESYLERAVEAIELTYMHPAMGEWA